MAISVGGTSILFPDGSKQGTANIIGMRNKIINGNMAIDQRNAGAAVTAIDNSYQLDRWASIGSNTGGAREVQQSTDTPSPKFLRSIRNTQITGAVTTLNEYVTRQTIELPNIYNLAGGSIVASFWYKSNRIGSHGIRFVGNIAAATVGGIDDNKTFTVDAANTWEYKTVTSNAILGVTSWGNTLLNARAMRLDIGFRTSSQGLSSVGLNDYYMITGVQLEAGTVATPFEDRPHGLELSLCQRYYTRFNYSLNNYIGNLQAYTAGACFGVLTSLPTEMRAVPTTSISSIGHFSPYNAAGSPTTAFTIGTLNTNTTTTLGAGNLSGSSGLVAGNASVVITTTANAWIDASSEL